MDSSLDEFHASVFANLPLELKHQIILLTRSGPRIVEIGYFNSPYGKKFVPVAPRLAPAALLVCSETRRLAKKTYQYLPACGWIDFAKDTVYLGPSFGWDGCWAFYYAESTKTLRASALSIATNYRDHFKFYPGRSDMIWTSSVYFKQILAYHLVVCEMREDSPPGPGGYGDDLEFVPAETGLSEDSRSAMADIASLKDAHALKLQDPTFRDNLGSAEVIYTFLRRTVGPKS